MKILVDKIVNHPDECFFSQWKSYPPIIEKPGDYYCSRVKKVCNLYNESNECYCFKEFKNE